MRKFALLIASALVLALGVATASAEPFDPNTGYSAPTHGYNGAVNEGRAASESGAQFNNGWATSNPALEQFHEAGR